MTVRVQSGEQLEEAADALESRGENVSNITYSAPTETGEVEVRLDEENQRRIAAAGMAEMARVFEAVKPDVAILIGNDQMEVFEDANIPAFMCSPAVRWCGSDSSAIRSICGIGPCWSTHAS